MAESKKAPPGIDLLAKKAKYDLLKSNNFRVVYVDGVFGGVGPRGMIHMTLFNTRWPIPTRMVHSLNEEGAIADELHDERQSRDAMVRELEIEVVMDTEAAIRLREWLERHLKTAIQLENKAIEKVIEARKAKGGKGEHAENRPAAPEKKS